MNIVKDKKISRPKRFCRKGKVKKQIKKLGLLQKQKQKENDLDFIKDIEFKSMDINELIIRGLNDMNIIKPTHIQYKSISVVNEYRNVMLSDKTGSGKTLAYLIPLCEILLRLKFRLKYGLGALVLLPTRELCLQVSSVFQKLTKYINFRYAIIDEVNDISQDKEELSSGFHVIFATPVYFNRMLKNKKTLLFIENLRFLALDEADQLLTPKYKDIVQRIISKLPEKRITMMLSATLPLDIENSGTELESFARIIFKKGCELISGRDGKSIPNNLQLDYVIIESDKRIQFLCLYLKYLTNKKILVFMNSPNVVEFYYKLFSIKQMKNVYMLHSKMKPNNCSTEFVNFNSVDSGILLCDDELSRGIDIQQIEIVIHYDLPWNTENYIHRIGRAGRGAVKGESLLMLRPVESELVLTEINKITNVYKYQCDSINTDETFTIPDNSDLKKLAEKACTDELFNYRKSKFIQNVNHINLEKEIINFGLSTVPKILLNTFHKV